MEGIALRRGHTVVCVLKGNYRPSQIMVDKVVSVKAERVREKIGRLSDEQMDQLDAALKRWLDL